jgi:steroid 5-alpha reductase family enzyme
MNNTSIFKISRIISIAFMFLGALFIFLVWYKGDETMKTSIEAQDGILNPFFYLAYFILGLTALLALVFPIAYSFSNPKQAVRGLIVVGLFVALFGLSYLLASDAISSDMIAKAVEEERISTGGIRRVGAGLIATYILIGAAVIVTVVSGFSKLFK